MLLFQRPDDAIHRGFDKDAEADISLAGNISSRISSRSTLEQAQEHRRSRGGVRQIHRADEAAAQRVCGGCRGRNSWFRRPIRAWWTGSPSKNPRYLQKRPDLVESAGYVSGGNRDAPGARDPRETAGALSGECRSGRPPQQSAGPKDGRAAAGCLQPDPLSGTAGAVHGLHLQPDREIAFDDRIRQRGRADERSVQRAVAGGGREQCAGVRHSHRVSRASPPPLDMLVRTIAWITTTACWCRNSGAACELRNAIRNF